MVESIKLIWAAFTDACIRFWENRFLVSSEIEFLRLEINKLNNERVKLLNYILESNSPVHNNDSSIIDEPIASKYVPWSVKKHRLEKESLEKLEKELLSKENSNAK